MLRASLPSLVFALALVGPVLMAACGIEVSVAEGPEGTAEAGPPVTPRTPDAAAPIDAAATCVDATLSCGVGACARTTPRCVNGVVQTCVAGGPVAEISCDGVDNDCNGETDEGSVGEVLSCGQGACARKVTICGDAGAQTCEEGQPSAEACDGIDNDCDGTADEELGVSECGVGSCRRTQPNCVGGMPQACVAGNSVDEILCDGADNDCDGTTDELGAFAPVAVTGFNVDAIAESSPANASTTGALDGADYVLYSVAYGIDRGTGKGLPNNGLVGPVGRRFQLAGYGGNNAVRIAKDATGTLTLTAPAATAAVSVLAFATEGAATATIVLDYTDNSSETFDNVAVPDWFTGAGSIVSQLDRTGRASNLPDNQATAPFMHALTPAKSCAGKAKMLRAVKITNKTTGSNVVAFAVSTTGL